MLFTFYHWVSPNPSLTHREALIKVWVCDCGRWDRSKIAHPSSSTTKQRQTTSCHWVGFEGGISGICNEVMIDFFVWLSVRRCRFYKGSVSSVFILVQTSLPPAAPQYPAGPMCYLSLLIYCCFITFARARCFWDKLCNSKNNMNGSSQSASKNAESLFFHSGKNTSNRRVDRITITYFDTDA